MKLQVVAAVVLGACGAAMGQAGDLFWTETITGKVQTMDTAGVLSPSLALNEIDPLALDADGAAQKVFFADAVGNLRRVNFDGTGLQTIVPNAFVSGQGVGVDPVNQKVWWSDFATGDIKNANYDGTGLQTVLTAQYGVGGLAIDPVGGKVYMAATGSIMSANINGTGLTTLYTPANGDLLDIALDSVNGKLYWTDNRNYKVQQSDLNGNNVQDVLTTGLSIPIGIDVEPSLGQFFVANKGSGQIVGANLNGSNAQVYYSAPGAQTWGLAVVVPSPGAVALLGLGTLSAVRRKRA